MNIKAIVLGVLTDWVATVILSIPIGIFGVIIHLTHGGSVGTFGSFFNSYTPLMLASIIAGSLGTIIGGIVTALVTKEKRIWNAFLMGISTSLIGIPFCLSEPLWFIITSLVLMVPCAMLGGWLVERRKRGQSIPPPLPQVKTGKTTKVLIALAMFPFLIYFAVVIYVKILGRDIPPPNTADLVLEREALNAEQNAFTYFVAATNSLYWPTNTSLITDYLDGKPVDDALIQQTISSNRVMLVELEKGLGCQRCLAPEVVSIDSDTPYLSPWRSMGRIMAIKARRDRLEGKYSEATRTCTSLLRFGDIIQKDAQCTIHYLVGLSVIDIGFTQAQDLARDVAIPPQELIRLTDALAHIVPFDHGFIRAIKSEYRAIANTIDQFQSGKLDIGEIISFSGQTRTSKFSHCQFQSGYMFQPNRTKQSLADTYRGMIRNATLPFANMTLLISKEGLDKRKSTLSLMTRPNAMGKILFGFMIPAMDNQSERRCRMDGDLAATRLVVACNAYIKKEGKLPDDLQALIPVYLPSVPVDPYDGRPFRYSRARSHHNISSATYEEFIDFLFNHEVVPMFEKVDDGEPSILHSDVEYDAVAVAGYYIGW